MLILGIGCSEKACSAALLDDGRVLGTTLLNSGLTHSENLVPLINGLLELTGKSYAAVDAYAVSVGPGSFTGVRIGVSTVKGLAFAGKKPCVGVSSLFGMAQGFAGFDAVICPSMDARHGQLYAALFRAEDGGIRRLTEDAAVPADEIAGIISEKYGNEKVLVCGGGTEILLSACRELKNVSAAPAALMHENGLSVALAARELLITGGAEIFPGGDGLRPVYLRPSQAERIKAQKEAEK